MNISEEIMKNLQSNLGNRLTPELIIGLHARFTTLANEFAAFSCQQAKVADTGQQAEPQDGEL